MNDSFWDKGVGPVFLMIGGDRGACKPSMERGGRLDRICTREQSSRNTGGAQVGLQVVVISIEVQ